VQLGVSECRLGDGLERHRHFQLGMSGRLVFAAKAFQREVERLLRRVQAGARLAQQRNGVLVGLT
jgi:hypothetical protein